MEISNASINLSPMANIPSAGYMTITNPTERVITIIDISSSFFEDIEWHETVIIDSVARMRTVPETNLKPGESVQLKKGANHLMLFERKKTLDAGQKIDLLFKLKPDGRTKISVPVKGWGSENHRKHHRSD